MNREIKFLAVYNGRVYPVLNIGFLYGEDMNDIHIDTDEGPFIANTSDIEAIMQYTGLKDKNGKGIYESYIVKLDDEYAVVRYGKHSYEGGYETIGFYLGNPDDNIEEYTITWSELEVVGNIYENPEFLK